MPYAEFKAPKGIIKVSLKLDGDSISEIRISGDFFMYPEEALDELEGRLVGVRADRESLLEALEKFYSETKVETPMIEPKHFVEAIMKSLRG